MAKVRPGGGAVEGDRRGNKAHVTWCIVGHVRILVLTLSREPLNGLRPGSNMSDASF